MKYIALFYVPEKTAPNLIHVKHLLSALKRSHLWQCPEVALRGAQLLSFAHRSNTLRASPLSIYFSHVHMSGQFSNFPTRKLQAIN